MQRLLGCLYRCCEMLAALFMVTIAVLILAQTIGRQLGLVVPDANEMAGYSFAALTFLALAPTFRAGAHIRVSLLITRLPAKLRFGFELWALTAGLGLVLYATWWIIDLAIGSFRYHDVSPGVVAFPLWIPQAAMAFGLIVMSLCLLETLIGTWRGILPSTPHGGEQSE
ncbi:MAG: TRAP transporter small permease [Candidatus Competibacteraceae bacterium]|nr:TRAP transporter small permease [Candidatus Competibacteraceae bacterium]